MSTLIERADLSAHAGAGRSFSLFARVWTWLDSRQRLARTVNELESLSDRELDDIGLNRADISRVARSCTQG